MTQDTQNQAPAAEAAKPKVTDYLEQPRSKKKEHAILALGDAIEPELKLSIHRMMKERHKSHVLVMPKDIKEILRNLGKKIAFLLIDDSFADWSIVEPVIIKLKETNQDTGVPTFFLTEDSPTLIQNYHQELFPYQELDDYIEYVKLERREILAAIDQLLGRQARRRSRRYSVNIPVTFSSLSHEERKPGEIIDFSMHGGLLKDDEGPIFKTRDQLQVFFNVSQALGNEQGEIMAVSSIIRRTGIGGNIAGISWEYLTDRKIRSLAKLISYYAKKDTDMKLRAFMAVQKKNGTEK